MVATSLFTLLIPLWILLGILVLLGVFGVLARFRGGRYVRPVFTGMAKVPFLRRLLERASRATMERTNPELASALRKLEPHAKHMNDPQQAQKAMSRLTREERAALLDMQEQQQDAGIAPEATNREMRRRLERARKRRW